MTFEEAKQEVERLRKLHFPEGFRITVTIRPRIKRWYGQCRVWKSDRTQAHITFAADLFKVCDDAHQTQTLRHEVAHALAFSKSGRVGHDIFWRAACKVVGCRDDVKTEAPPEWYRYETECTHCGHVFFQFHRLTEARAYRIRHGCCPKCETRKYGYLQLIDKKAHRVIIQGTNVERMAA